MDFRMAVKAGAILLGWFIGTSGLAQSTQDLLRFDGEQAPNAIDATRVSFWSNLFSDPCATCDYSDGPGYAVVGPDNCVNPGVTQWLAGMFIASATGVPNRISAAVILRNSADCPQNKVVLSIYSDLCFPDGPGRPLASGMATVPEAPCNLAIAKLRNAPALTKGVKYWVVAATNDQESGLDANWYGSNNSQYAFNTGTGWQHFTGGTPAFKVEGPGTLFSDSASGLAATAFGCNLLVDPCSGCSYDVNSGAFEVRGPDNCTAPGMIHSEAVAFIAAKSGVPSRISAPIIIKNAATCPANKVTLSIYTDSCDLGPTTLLASGVATAGTAPCDMAVAKLRNAPALQKSVKYWVVASAGPDQTHLDAVWYSSNFAQFAFGDLSGWFQSSAATPAFLLQ